jgi:hypothetical protein
MDADPAGIGEGVLDTPSFKELVSEAHADLRQGRENRRFKDPTTAEVFNKVQADLEDRGLSLEAGKDLRKVFEEAREPERKKVGLMLGICHKQLAR